MNLAKIIDDAEKAAAENIKREDGDYIGEDGLLYCGKCGTNKQTIVNIFGRERKPFCLCKCQTEKRDREEAERQRREFEKRVAELRKTGFPESEMSGWTFDNDDGENAKITGIMRNYVDNFDRMKDDGKGLLLFGSVGTGKTFAAVCVANALIDKGIPVLVTKISRIVNIIQERFEGRQAYLDSLNRFPLLVLDDLKAERNTEFVNEIVYDVIDGRCRAKLPLIVTTNLTSDELKHPADVTNQRTFSRLFEMCIPLEVEGKDRRRERLKEDYKEYKDILGI